MKVHLGCGTKILSGWVNCDIQNLPGVDIVSSFETLSFESESLSEVYACHMLEHFSRHDISSIIAKLNGWLKVGGKLWIAVPDFEACARHYSKYHDVQALIGLTMGGQKNEWDFHKMLFDFKNLNKFLAEGGFHHIERYNRADHDIAKQGIDDYSAAFLPHMDPNGLLMSLNVVAIKK
jgi:predicted SAM-dependent methyltransferase